MCALARICRVDGHLRWQAGVYAAQLHLDAELGVTVGGENAQAAAARVR